MPRPLYSWGRDPVPNVQEADWAPGLVWTGAENLATHWDSNSDCPANSEPIYRLCYPGPPLRVCVFRGTTASGPGPPHYRGYTITVGHTTLSRTLLDEWSARRWDLYLTTHSTHKRKTSMHPAASEPAIPTSDRPQTHALDRAATGIGVLWLIGAVNRFEREWLMNCKKMCWKYGVAT